MNAFQKLIQKTTAKAAVSCFLLLLLYGCAQSKNELGDAMLLADETQQAMDGSEIAVVDDAAETQTVVEQTKSGAETEYTLAVYVCGAVKCPGVYELPEGSRVYEALALAGGLTDDASPTAVNQAQLLSDGEMIEILTVAEAETKETTEQAVSDGRVNINTASVEELKALPGIGDAKAQSIVAYREKNGAFTSIEDIKKIEGIKDGVFAKLEDCIKTE